MKYLRILWFMLITLACCPAVMAQNIALPQHISPLHPRLLTDAEGGREKLKALIAQEAWAGTTYQAIKNGVDPYVTRHETDSTWMVSRLQMYWNAHYTDVYVKNGAYVSGFGKAPVPTVRFTGTRDVATAYSHPRLEDIKPYMDQDGKIYLQNRSAPGQPWEWVEQSKTGRTIEAINIDIINKARDAAMIYWYTGDEKYGRFAYDIFNTYLTGMYYRNEPIDLNHGHDQTLVGLSAFEVIHEDVLEPLTASYDFLYSYIKKYHPAKMPLYAGAFKKWADIIIKNGVPFNNWDLIEARFTAEIALVLDDNTQYPDGRGCQYYLDQVLNKTATRQWALMDLLRKGYNKDTGIWSECPGYSVGVLGDFTGFVNFFDRTLKIDFLPQMAILPKAVLAQAQYLYPNGYIVGFGDTHYGRLPTRDIEDMIRNARLYHKTEQEETYTRMLKTIQGIGRDKEMDERVNRNGFSALFANPPLTLSPAVKAGNPGDYLTATFWSPNVSWFVQRNGLDIKNGLMVSQAGSAGNHAHANGIAMELYGEGVIMAPEGGIGGSYFQTDYAEYYSQFPAHNTVVVDGISSYPTMKSNHGFELKSCYPESAQRSGYFPGITFSDVYFLEPETNADQDRLMSIIRTSDTSGYYVDFFRSKKKNGDDKFHDYIYHNLGQQVNLTDDDNHPLNLQPTDKLTFANMELMGYDYWWDKKSVTSAGDFKARFALSIPGREALSMNMWMKGYPDREIFSVKAPPSRSWRNNEMIPDSIANMPLPTVVVRQSGEAWKRPFATIFEPASGLNGSAISSITSFSNKTADSTFVGILVESRNGLKDYIMTGADKPMSYRTISFTGSYGVIRTRGGDLNCLFLGNGTAISMNGYRLSAVKASAAAFWLEQGEWYFTANKPVSLSLPANRVKGALLNLMVNKKLQTFKGTAKTQNGQSVIEFNLPAMQTTGILINR